MIKVKEGERMGNKEPNKLIEEKSPYLQQHAYNPVEWHPWGEEAFEKAKRENKPIFLSIGYSTCHWCHVMAHESFEDEETAEMLNKRFVSIKVDREERPDIDSIYMRVCQMLTQHGGWPLSVFLTPEQKPFYAGTYFPKTSKYGIPSFRDVITQLYDQYHSDPEKITKASNQITEVLNAKVEVDKENRLSGDVLHQAFQQLENSFDETFGGFGGAPKFPSPHNMMFLMRYYQWTGNENGLNYATETLNSIYEGGINDHIGYGFARYSVDEKWLVPHFEKMLYDNALLLTAFTEAHQLTENERFQQAADQIVTFVGRELTDENGGFYSAIDADSEGVEGKYYIWDYSEVLNILGPDIGEIFAEVYQITRRGNFEEENIPNLIGTDWRAIAEKYDMDVEELEELIERGRKELLKVRGKRVYPHVDDKILTSWNALMIAGLAKASRVFRETGYLTAADKALIFIEDKLYVGGRLMVRYRDGEVKHKGHIDDYAFLLWAYMEMFQTTFDLNYLSKARQVKEQLLDLFWDNEQGGFFFSGKDGEGLIAREKEVYDAAMPSGNAVAAVSLQKLAGATGDLELLDLISEMFATFKEEVEHHPSGFTFFLQSLIQEEAAKKEVVIIGDRDDPDRQRLITAIQHKFLPHVSVLVAEEPETFRNIAPFAAEYRKLEDKTTIYICENFACRQPTTDIDQALNDI